MFMSGNMGMPQNQPPTTDQPKKARKPLKLPTKSEEFKPTGESKDILDEFFKKEIEDVIKSQKSGKMFSNWGSTPKPGAKVQGEPAVVEFKKEKKATTTTQPDAKKQTQQQQQQQQQQPPKKEETKAGVAKKKEQEKEQQKVGKQKIEEAKQQREYKKLKAKGQKEKIDIESIIKDQTKYDEAIDENRDPLNIVFIGHVDAGKSTICGNILLLSGKIDPQEVRKLQNEAKEKNRESWYLAYIMDIGDEEKNKGKTVEVGKARFDTEHKRFTILDAPGHKNYVPNMISGASQADVACLVISAKSGEFESGFDKGGQTTEHAMLAKALGVTSLVIVVNKMDEGSVQWSRKRYEEIQQTLLPFLKTSCGYNEDEIYWVPISGLNGENIKDGIKSQAGKWYNGKTLFETIDTLPLPKRDEDAPVRLPILDRYKDTGALTIDGKLESGTIIPGMKLTLVPSGDSIEITSILNNEDKRVPYAKPGDNVKLTIKGTDEDKIARGDIVCSNYDFCQVCYVMECEIKLLDLPEHKPIMSSGYQCVMHIHSALEEVYIKEILAEYDKKDDKANKARFLKSSSVGLVRIEALNNAICCEKYERMPQLGRFTLRDEGLTIATGTVKRVKTLYKD